MLHGVKSQAKVGVGGKGVFDGGGAGLTVTRTWLVVVPPHPVANNVNVVELFNVTVREPGVGTPPMAGSMTALVAFVTGPQLSVVDCPAVIVCGLAVKNAMPGGPGQTNAGGRVFVGIGIVGLGGMIVAEGN